MTPGREIPALFATISCVQPLFNRSAQMRAPSVRPDANPTHSSPKKSQIRWSPAIVPLFCFSSSQTVLSLMRRASPISTKVLPFAFRLARIRLPMFIFVTSQGVKTRPTRIKV